MKIGYYPGCSLLGTAREYGESLEAVSSAFGIQLEEVQDWNCCGATAAHSLNKTLSVALPARTLALAEQQKMAEIVVPCAACYNRLLTAFHELSEDFELREKVSKIIEMPINCTAEPINVIEFLNKYILPEIQTKVTNPWNQKVACYYGCLLVRPPKLMKAERFEDPLTMENLMKKIGSTAIDWAFKTECCGASLSFARTDIVGKLSGKVVGDAVERGAQAIIVACPMCHSNLDMRRDFIRAYLKKDANIPVMYITQAIGLALGIAEKDLGLQRHFVPVELKATAPVEKVNNQPKKVAEV